jgi:hypothetical protein
MNEQNAKKAYHVATTASALIWGGEHGWESPEVGEFDLSNALRKKLTEPPASDLVKRRTLQIKNGTNHPALATISMYVSDWTTDRFEVFTVIAGSVPVRTRGTLSQCIYYGDKWFEARIKDGWSAV